MDTAYRTVGKIKRIANLLSINDLSALKRMFAIG